MAEKLSVMEQVALMLEKAKTTTPGEAEMLTARAEKLMIRHGLTEAMLEAASPTVKDEPIVKRTIRFHNTFAAALVNLGMVAEAFGTMRALQSGTKNTYVLWIVGHESDADRVVPLIVSLEEQAHRAMRDWWKREGKERCYWMTTQQQWMARRQFYNSFAAGVASRVREELQEVKSERTGSDLVLVGRLQRVNDSLGKTGQARAKKSSAVGQSAGWEAGRNGHRGGEISS